SGPAGARNGEMQRRFRGGFAFALHEAAVLVDFHDLLRLEQAFVEAARGDGERERMALHHGAEIAARPQRPAARVTVPCDCGEVDGQRLEVTGEGQWFR